MLAPETGYTTSTSVVYRFSFVTNKWARTTYPWTFKSLSRDFSTGQALAGTTDGKIIVLDASGISQDAGQDIPIELWSRYDDGGNPLVYKDAFDVQVGVDTGGYSVVTSVFDEDDNFISFPTTTVGTQAYRYDIGDAEGDDGWTGSFRLAQIRMTGSVGTFRLRHWNISYRPRPQHTMRLDTGHVMADKNGDRIDVKELEITAKSSNDLVVNTYCDGVLRSGPTTITVSGDGPQKYNLILPRGTWGSRIRIVVETAASASAINPGFELEMIRIRAHASGNKSRRSFIPIFPLQEGAR